MTTSAFTQLASSLFDLVSAATEMLADGTTVGVMIHQPSDGPSMETWPHLGIATVGYGDGYGADIVSYLFAENFAALGRLESKRDDLFEEDGLGLIYDVSDGRKVLARVALTVILPSGLDFTIDEEWFIHEFAVTINSMLYEIEEDYLSIPIVRHVRGHLYKGGPLHDDDIKYGPEEEEEEDFPEEP